VVPKSLNGRFNYAMPNPRLPSGRKLPRHSERLCFAVACLGFLGTRGTRGTGVTQATSGISSLKESPINPRGLYAQAGKTFGVVVFCGYLVRFFRNLSGLPKAF
jgi:hypothetical protein